MFKKKRPNKLENLLLDFPSGSRFAESYRTLRTNLYFSVMEKDLDSILITSSVEAEGKTTSAINLAYTICQTGKKTLIVDADLRRPRLTETFSFKKETGLSELISTTLGERLTEGSLSDYSMGDLLQLTRLQKRTIELNIKDDTDEISFYFVRGILKDIYWVTRPESKKLANTLIRNNLLTEQEARLALGHQRKSVLRLGTVLLSMGLVTKPDLTKTLSVHTIESITAASSITSGRFRFINYSQDDAQLSVSHDVNLDDLINEFLVQSKDHTFIKKAVTQAVKPTATENLYILPSGKVPPNPSELLNSERTEFLINYLKKQYDVIILDSPPVMPATDALVIAPRVDGTILVVRSGHTEKKIVKDVVNRFETAHLPLMGVLLNRVDVNKEGYYRYYKKYYSSYYGE